MNNSKVKIVNHTTKMFIVILNDRFMKNILI